MWKGRDHTDVADRTWSDGKHHANNTGPDTRAKPNTDTNAHADTNTGTVREHPGRDRESDSRQCKCS